MAQRRMISRTLGGSRKYARLRDHPDVGLFAQAVIFYAALSLAPGIELSGFWPAFWASWLYAFLVGCVSWVIDANDVQIYGDDYSTPDRTCIRDYVHVIDLARAHILALGILGERSSIYNLGCGGDGYSVKEVIDTAREVTGRQINTRVGPRRAGDPAMLVASSEKIRRELGWEPKFQDLRVIIQSAWDWMSRHPQGYSE